MIKHFKFVTFYVFLDFYTHKNKSIKVRSNAKIIKTMHMQDAQMHDNEASNAWRVQQRSKELDQGPKEQKLNHWNPFSSKRNDCLEWVSHEKWDES